jgi:ABC-type Fe3+ transport system permease subunit
MYIKEGGGMAGLEAITRRDSWLRMHQPDKSTIFVGSLVVFLAGYVLYPTILIVSNSFNLALSPRDPFDFGFDNWVDAFTKPGIFTAIWHTVLLWALYTFISFPLAVLISWSLARMPIPGSYTLEFLFWVSFMMPAIAVATGWIMLMDPNLGFINKLLVKLPFIDKGPFNIFSIPGIVWVQLMSHAISGKVMLLTPAFRNMDSTMGRGQPHGRCLHLQDDDQGHPPGHDPHPHRRLRTQHRPPVRVV